MPSYTVTVSVKLEATATFSFRAKTQEAAEEKAAAIASELCILRWDGTGDPAGVEWEEISQETEVDAVERDD
jgi:hypothetical protein